MSSSSERRIPFPFARARKAAFTSTRTFATALRTDGQTMGAGASRARRKSKDYIIAATTPIDSLSPESSIFSVAEVQSTVEVLFACDESELSAAELQNRWKLGPSDFSLFSDQLISGRGTTSRVVCASIHGSNNLAAKRYDSPQPAIWRDYFDRELLALSHIQHSNVVTLVGVCDAPESRCIIMERVTERAQSSCCYKN